METKRILFIVTTVVISLIDFQTVNSHPDDFGKPCSKDYYPDDVKNHIQCDRDRNFHCSEKGICECIKGEGGRVFAHHQKACIEIASTNNDFACTEDIQCKLSLYGKFSRCNRDTDNCECFNENEKTTLVENVCYLQMSQRAIGRSGLQGCSNDEDCKQGKLGANSRCNLATSSCECYNWGEIDREVAFYNGTCVYKKNLSQLCNDNSECRAGFHKNAVCAGHPSYLPAEKICQCPKDVDCDGSSGYSPFRGQLNSILMTGLTTALMGILATKIIS